MRTLEEMGSTGRTKLTDKASTMASSYTAAKSRMKDHFAKTPFGPTRKSAYNTGVDKAVWHAPDPSTWYDNWIAKMRE